MPVFIFDIEILEKLPEDDARVSFIHKTLQKMRDELQKKYGSSIAIYHGTPEKIFQDLTSDYEIQKMYTNRDYEPYAKERDKNIQKLLKKHEVEFLDFKDQVIFEEDEVVKQDGNPYVVYTPYKNTWKQRFRNTALDFHYTSSYLNNLIENRSLPNLSLKDIGFKKSALKVPGYKLNPGLIKDYKKKRDYPAIEGTSRLGPHLRFGTVSIRQIVREANREKNKTFLEEKV